ncbi:MAG: hypothetical protein GF350_11430, partial [Chitinivibrionales bacterium]|nr:hypothetical protein [Chitinivibrionales bacterium]
MAKKDKLIEVTFKGERKALFRNRHELELDKEEYVIVEADRGKDLGWVSLIGGLVRLKRGKGETKSIIRKATENDLKSHEDNKKKEVDAFKVCKTKIKEHGLEMKLVDVEMQF